MSVFTFASHWSERDSWLHPADQRPPTFDEEFSFWEAPNNFNHAPMVIPRNRHWHGFDFRRFPGRPCPVSSPSLSNLVQATILAANMQKASVTTVNTPLTTEFQKFSFWANIVRTESTGRGEPSFSIVIWMVFSRRCTFRLDKGILRGCNHPFVLFLTEHLPLCQLLPTTQSCNGDWKPQTENYSF